MAHADAGEEYDLVTADAAGADPVAMAQTLRDGNGRRHDGSHAFVQAEIDQHVGRQSC